MSSGPSIPRSERKRKGAEFTLPRDVLAALAAHCARTGEAKSAVVERALRVELKMKEKKG